MKRLILIAGLCSFVGMAFLTANADTVYVSPDGDDANAGTSDVPNTDNPRFHALVNGFKGQR